MIQTRVYERLIIEQRFYRRYGVMRILKGIVAGIITALILYAIVAINYSMPYSVIPPILAIFGAFLIILSILSNIKRNSPIKLGVASRGEFYGVVVVLISILLSMNGRIDALYQILITMK